MLELFIIASMLKSLENECAFQTDRLIVSGYVNYANDQPDLAMQVINIMSPEVTASLPSGWQNIRTETDANNWINEITNECNFLLVQHEKTSEIIGFIFLYEADNSNSPLDIRLGYLLSEKMWGRGLGGELIEGLLAWCASSAKISSITGGVEPGNVGSMKVLIKNGFVKTGSDSDGTLFYEYNFCQN
jgi:RimJ/RimL family protein N-acetyltransferase